MTTTEASTCDAVKIIPIADCAPVVDHRVAMIPVRIPIPGRTDHLTVAPCGISGPTPTDTISEAEFRSLPLAPSTITVGPAQGWLPVNMAAVVYTDNQPQTLTTTLLGQPVTVRATPTTYTWTWADDCPPTKTIDPGTPWPDYTLSHTYQHTGTYTVTMTTTWTGEYSLDAGTTYTPITSTATTTSTAPPLTVTELRTHLVEDLVG